MCKYMNYKVFAYTALVYAALSSLAKSLTGTRKS